MIFWYQKFIYLITDSILWYLNFFFLYQEFEFVISKNELLISQNRFFYIKNYVLISIILNIDIKYLFFYIRIYLKNIKTALHILPPFIDMQNFDRRQACILVAKYVRYCINAGPSIARIIFHIGVAKLIDKLGA